MTRILLLQFSSEVSKWPNYVKLRLWSLVRGGLDVTKINWDEWRAAGVTEASILCLGVLAVRVTLTRNDSRFYVVLAKFPKMITTFIMELLVFFTNLQRLPSIPRGASVNRRLHHQAARNSPATPNQPESFLHTAWTRFQVFCFCFSSKPTDQSSNKSISELIDQWNKPESVSSSIHVTYTAPLNCSA